MIENTEGEIVHVEEIANITNDEAFKNCICSIIEKGVLDKEYDMETPSKYLLNVYNNLTFIIRSVLLVNVQLNPKTHLIML